jgi:peptidylprolyl isomerase
MKGDFVNKKRVTLIVGLIAALFLMLGAAACGPAVPREDTGGGTATPESVVEQPTIVDLEADSGAGLLDFNQRMPEEVSNYVVTDTGLNYFDLAEGEGPAPADGDIVTVHYVIWLAEGFDTPGPQLLDDSQLSGQPLTFVLGNNQVLPGWEEGVSSMQVGGVRQLVLPPELGFGADGGGMLPPDTTLIMEVSLLDVVTAPVATAVSRYTSNDSGLQYADLTVGSGDLAADGDLVLVDFTIWVAESGRYFTGSNQQGAAFDFRLGSGQVFTGWEEGMVGMQVGGKRQLLIPSGLALGEEGFGDAIPPNSDLLMEVELLSLSKPLVRTEVDEADFTTTESGLRYFDIVEGDGAMPQVGQTAVVHYTGWLEETGVQFDSSVDRGEPFQFPVGLGNVIAGWDEGVATMRVGGKRQLIVPAELGYGAAGAGGAIPPNATLIFEVELLDIK